MFARILLFLCLTCFGFFSFKAVALAATSVLVESFSTPSCNHNEETHQFLTALKQSDPDVMVLNCTTLGGTTPGPGEKDINEICRDRERQYKTFKQLLPNGNALMIINGIYDVLAGYTHVLESGIALAKSEKPILSADVEKQDDILNIRLPQALTDTTQAEMDLWLFAYQKTDEMTILRENEEHRRMHELGIDHGHDHTHDHFAPEEHVLQIDNMVKHAKRLGSWNGQGETIGVNLQGLDYDGYVIIAQEADYGPVRVMARYGNE